MEEVASYSTDTKYDLAKRYRIVTEMGNTYFTVIDVSIDITIADENQPRYAQLRSDLEHLCITSSKRLKHGATHQSVAEELRKYDHEIARMMVEKLEVYIGHSAK